MDNNEAPPVRHVGGQPVAELLHRHRAELVARVLTRLRDEIPAYRRLPAEALSGDILQVTDRNLRTFLEVLTTGRPPSDETLAALRESAARRAEEGIPVEYVLSAYHLGVQVIWEFVSADARPEDVADLAAVNAEVLRYLQAATAAVAAGYLEERQTISGDEQLTRHTLLAALLDGNRIEDAAERAAVRLPEQYLVLSVAVGPHPDESAPGVDAAIAARRKLRRLRVELQRQVREPALTALTDDRGAALVPLPAPPEWPWVRQLVAALSRAAGAPVTAGVTTAPPAGVRAAAELARNLLDVALTLGRPPGPYRLDDLLLEYQLSRPSEARDRLAARLDPLDDHPELLHTLVTFLRLGRARRPTAAELHLHPNTVDYRMRKVTSLTGLDPMDGAHTAALEAALVARAARDD